MNDPTQISIYQLRAVLNGVSPLVWRRLLLSSEYHQRLQDHYKFPPLEALSMLAETAQSVFSNGSCAGIDFEELEEATHRVEAYLRFRDRKFDCQRLNRELSELNRSGGAQ